MKTKKWITTILMFAFVLSLVAVSGCEFFGSSDPSEPAVTESRKISRAAQEVMDAIDDIGTVTLKSEDAIVEAEALYSALSDAEKEVIANYDLLLEARNTLDQLKLQGFAADYLIQVKAALLYPESVSLNHVYAAGTDGSYYFCYDMTVQNMLGEEEERVYGNTIPVELNEESLELVGENIAFSGLIGNLYWQTDPTMDEDAVELSASAIQAAYEASF